MLENLRRFHPEVGSHCQRCTSDVPASGVLSKIEHRNKQTNMGKSNRLPRASSMLTVDSQQLCQVSANSCRLDSFWLCDRVCFWATFDHSSWSSLDWHVEISLFWHIMWPNGGSIALLSHSSIGWPKILHCNQQTHRFKDSSREDLTRASPAF